MGSGARLRSENEVFGRSRTGAFLLTAAVEPVLTGCDYLGGADVTTNLGPIDGDVAASDGNCVCSTFPVVFEQRGFETRLSMSQQKGLGWEDPPHPAVRFTGQASGAVIFVPEHCATQVCPGTANAPIYWEDYCVNLGASGADYLCIKSGLFAREGELPVTNQLLYAYYALSGPGSPWIDGEEVLMEITYTASTLPDPGPYAIQSIIPDPDFSPDFMRFNLDRLPRWTTQSVVEIAGTGSAYDGIWEGNLVTDELSSFLEVLVPNYGPLGAGGTLVRNYSQEWDCWHNDNDPVEPKPEIPGGSVPQAWTIEELSVFDPNKGFIAGSYGALVPPSWEGVGIDRFTCNANTDVTTLITTGNVPIYGTSGISVWFEGLSGTSDGRWDFTPLVPGQGTYEITSNAVRDHVVANLNNTLNIGISENS